MTTQARMVSDVNCDDILVEPWHAVQIKQAALKTAARLFAVAPRNVWRVITYVRLHHVFVSAFFSQDVSDDLVLQATPSCISRRAFVQGRIQGVSGYLPFRLECLFFEKNIFLNMSFNKESFLS